MRNPLLLTAASGVLVVSLAVQAQQAPPANLVPMTAASLAAQPERYLGQTVAVYAAVETRLSATAFSVDQDPKRATLADILVLAPTLQSPVTPGAYITIVGSALRFEDAVSAAKSRGLALDLPADAATRFRGRPVVLAVSVFDAANTDLARVPPVPLSKEEVAFDAVMKQVNPTLGDLRKALDAADPAAAKAHGEKLRALFEDTRRFFAARAAADAVGWAGEAATLVESVTTGAASNNWTAARDAAAKIQPLCASCHNAHRERQDDGSYRVKKMGQ